MDVLLSLSLLSFCIFHLVCNVWNFWPQFKNYFYPIYYLLVKWCFIIKWFFICFKNVKNKYNNILAEFAQQLKFFSNTQQNKNPHSSFINITTPQWLTISTVHSYKYFLVFINDLDCVVSKNIYSFFVSHWL